MRPVPVPACIDKSELEETSMVEGNVSEPLRSLLEFESEKHCLPIAYHRQNLRDAEIHGPFRAVVEIHVHTDSDPVEFAIPVNGSIIPVITSVFSTPMSGVVGPEVDGEMLPIAYLKGRHILIPFDLEGLESGVPNTVNRIFNLIAEYALADAAEAITTYDWKEERERYSRIKKLALDRCVISLRRDIDDNSYEVDRKTREVRELVLKNEELRDALEHLERCKPRRVEENAVREFLELRKLTPKPYAEIVFDETSLRAKTGRIDVDHYDLGRFEVQIEFDTDRLTISQLEPDRVVEGYGHPHIDPHGSPCLGNIGVSLAKLLALKQYPPALVVIHQFLASYNEDNPYIKIERWDPDYDEGRNYDDCYEDSSTLDCVSCGDDNCPFWEDRYDRCAEFGELDRCLACRDCDHYLTEIEACRDSSSSQDCVGCAESRCPHAGDEDGCYEAHDGEDCLDCDRDSCRHYPDQNEDEEEDDAERVDQSAGA